MWMFPFNFQFPHHIELINQNFFFAYQIWFFNKFSVVSLHQLSSFLRSLKKLYLLLSKSIKRRHFIFCCMKTHFFVCFSCWREIFFWMCNFCCRHEERTEKKSHVKKMFKKLHPKRLFILHTNLLFQTYTRWWWWWVFSSSSSSTSTRGWETFLFLYFFSLQMIEFPIFS